MMASPRRDSQREQICNSRLRVGFIGAGNMAFAIAEGFIASGYIKSDQIFSTAPTNNNIRKFRDMGCHATNDNSTIFAGAKTTDHGHSENGKSDLTFVIFVCVKPHIALKLPGFWDFLTKKNFIDSIASSSLIIISALAGVPMSTLKMSIDSHFKDNFTYQIKLARIMPNTAVAVNAGTIGLALHSSANSVSEQITTLLNKLGSCSQVAEDQLDAVVGVAGSGIAYMYSMIQAMADGGVLMGLPRETALKLAAQTAAGAAKMVLRGEEGPIALRDKVCSPGGTTITGLYALEKGGFNAAVMAAMEASTNKSREFSRLCAPRK